MSYISVSTWSLHRMLGPLRWTYWDADSTTHRTHVEDQPQTHSLLDLPGEAARRGYRAIEVCHFHFPSTDTTYLQDLRRSFDTSGIGFDTLLLDYGDLTAADETRRNADIRLFRDWIGIAAQCGANRIRLVAGEASPTDEQAIRRSAAALSELAEYAGILGVRVVTENFKPMTSTGESCLKLLDSAGSGVGMITDFGNFHGDAKYAEIAQIAPISSSIHAKPAYDDKGNPDEEEFARCLEAMPSDYDGAYVLIYDGPGDMWEGLERVKKLVESHIRQ
ncbi:sugar phosphate isomerase/epimerase family protein [Cohnella terricola]|uniref:TIM barrel protein n=1 Tax=Cohnella terricola TaxID=1289167 RepID=A0A559JTT1_9BACL|nr:sugar phosphate isomerase/epimerase family protein [Cohnella terricola]TVY03281.1 TIM barrel protein [Cohnella terricola]